MYPAGKRKPFYFDMFCFIQFLPPQATRLKARECVLDLEHMRKEGKFKLVGVLFYWDT